MSELELIITDKYLELVPRPNPHDYKALQESIIVHGQREPIICNAKGEILDGHTRYEICCNLGLPPKFRVEIFETETLERGYVIEANLKRRHLTNYQKVELAYRLFQEMKVDSRKRTNANLDFNKPNAKSRGRITDNLGREIGVGRNSFQMSLTIIEKAPDELKERLRAGGITITEAYHSLLTPTKQVKHQRKKMVQCPCCKEVFNKSDLIKMSNENSV